jgi:hypothetical protein
MSGLVEGISSNKWVQSILLCWLAPLFAGAIAFVIVVLPDVRHAAVIGYLASADHALHINKFLFLFAISLTVAAILFVIRLTLWRILEGYLWPPPLRTWRVARAHGPQAQWLRATLRLEQARRTLQDARTELERAQQLGSGDVGQLSRHVTDLEKLEKAWQASLVKATQIRASRGRADQQGQAELPGVLRRRLRPARPMFTFGRPDGGDGEWLMPYPSDARIMPTKLGSAMRCMEAYGAEKYGLDSQIMWFELLDVAPASLKSALDDTSLEADTLLCGIYTAAGLAAAALAGAAWRASLGIEDTKLWVVAGVSIVLALALYRALLGTAATWAFEVRSLVDGGRDPLRRRLGLRSPQSPADEQRMWTALVGSRWYDHSPERFRILAEYRDDDQSHCAG